MFENNILLFNILTDIHCNKNTGNAGCHVAVPDKMAFHPLRVYGKMDNSFRK